MPIISKQAKMNSLINMNSMTGILLTLPCHWDFSMYNTAKHGEVVAKSRRLSYEHKNNGTSQSKGLFEMWEVLIGKGIRMQWM